jgi:hypothetical protein
MHLINTLKNNKHSSSIITLIVFNKCYIDKNITYQSILSQISRLIMHQIT